MKPPASIDDFQRLDIRTGVVVHAEPFPEARNPSLKLRIDFGPGVGVLQSSARLTRHYTPEGLLGSKVLAVVNFPPLRVAGFRSECLVLGMVNPDDPGEVLLVTPTGPGGPDLLPADPTGWRLG